jgi:hypothetical protein
MEHQPFKTWLSENSPLTPVEQENLRDHLAVCTECSLLARDLKALDSFLGKAISRTPSPGFPHRFLVSLPERREVEQVRQVRKWIIGLIIALIVNMALIITAAIITRTASTWLVNLAVAYGTIIGLLQQTQFIYQAFSLVIPPQFWMLTALVALSWGLVGVGLWVWTLRGILFSGVKNG